jgi:hypothetical protein
MGSLKDRNIQGSDVLGYIYFLDPIIEEVTALFGLLPFGLEKGVTSDLLIQHKGLLTLLFKLRGKPLLFLDCHPIGLFNGRETDPNESFIEFTESALILSDLDVQCLDGRMLLGQLT